ncbi:MAG: Asp23/Gls24 family envelope stress response protein [Oscillospiraceae bacterium]|nr:Asp23/Gls24 family envelope stress response protein [Oscillospiraceae bacterium]
MEFKNTSKQEGGLQISTAVIEKVAKIATLEVDGVKDVSVGTTGVKGIFAKTNLPKSVEVNMYEGVADITVHIIAEYGSKLPAMCREIQNVVKNSVQNMTNITVSKVNIVVAGVETSEEE